MGSDEAECWPCVACCAATRGTLVVPIPFRCHGSYLRTGP